MGHISSTLKEVCQLFKTHLFVGAVSALNMVTDSVKIIHIIQAYYSTVRQGYYISLYTKNVIYCHTIYDVGQSDCNCVCISL